MLRLSVVRLSCLVHTHGACTTKSGRKAARLHNVFILVSLPSLHSDILQAFKQQTALAKWDSSVRGVWPLEEYMKLADQETRMMANLAW
ncbi:hypothetical protein BC835DRAFT_1344533, partial [Cytidiella melzeri]